MLRCCLIVGVLGLLSSSAAMAAKKDKPFADSKATVSERSAQEQALARMLTGATLVGRYTTVGKTDATKPSSDRYDIEQAKKSHGDRWIITARIKYGKHDLKVPVPLDILWAGDTPVITLTKLTIPALGTFTARIMIYGDRYAGTWQHNKSGGHMWGRIEHVGDDPLKPADDSTPDPSDSKSDK